MFRQDQFWKMYKNQFFQMVTVTYGFWLIVLCGRHPVRASLRITSAAHTRSWHNFRPNTEYPATGSIFGANADPSQLPDRATAP